MIEKSDPLPWVEAQDRPHRGVRDIEKGAPGAVFSTQPHHKPPDTTTTASRNNTVICPHLGKIYDTFNAQFYTKNTITHAASNKNHKAEATTESAGLALRSAGLGQSVWLTLDAARRKGSPQSDRDLGRIRLQNSLKGSTT